MTTATKPCDLCQKQPAQWRWWVRDTRTSPIARLMDLCHECEELDSVHFITHSNMEIDGNESISTRDVRASLNNLIDALIDAAKDEGAREAAKDNAAIAEVAKQVIAAASTVLPRKD